MEHHRELRMQRRHKDQHMLRHRKERSRVAWWEVMSNKARVNNCHRGRSRRRQR
jgi:hypothetical protein